MITSSCFHFNSFIFSHICFLVFSSQDKDFVIPSWLSLKFIASSSFQVSFSLFSLSCANFTAFSSPLSLAIVSCCIPRATRLRCNFFASSFSLPNSTLVFAVLTFDIAPFTESNDQDKNSFLLCRSDVSVARDTSQSSSLFMEFVRYSIIQAVVLIVHLYATSQSLPLACSSFSSSSFLLISTTYAVESSMAFAFLSIISLFSSILPFTASYWS